MENWLNMRAMQMNQQLAEDVSAPELRNPLLWRYHRARKSDQAEIGITAQKSARFGDATTEAGKLQHEGIA